MGRTQYWIYSLRAHLLQQAEVKEAPGRDKLCTPTQEVVDPDPKALAVTWAFYKWPAGGAGDPLSGATSANLCVRPAAGRRQFVSSDPQRLRLPSSLSDLSGPRSVVKAPPASFPPSCGERTQPASERHFAPPGRAGQEEG